MPLMLGSNKKSAAAIDLGADAVRIVEMAWSRGQYKLLTMGEQHLAAGKQDDLPARHLTALGELLRTHKPRGRAVVACMPTSLVLTRNVQVDANKPASTEDQVKATLQNCLPYDSRDAVFDCWTTSEGANGRRDMLVVAAQASVVRQYLNGFERLGLSCVHLDVAPCAMAALIHHISGGQDGVVGAITLAGNVGCFAIVQQARVLFWRPFDLTAARPGAAAPSAQVDLERVGDEISKCVSHMVGTMRVDNLAELVLFGQGSDDAAVNQYLKDRFGVPVRSPSPLSVMPEDEPAAAPGASASHYLAAVGLAMQQLTEVAAHG